MRALSLVLSSTAHYLRPSCIIGDTGTPTGTCCCWELCGGSSCTLAFSIFPRDAPEAPPTAQLPPEQPPPLLFLPDAVVCCQARGGVLSGPGNRQDRLSKVLAFLPVALLYRYSQPPMINHRTCRCACAPGEDGHERERNRAVFRASRYRKKSCISHARAALRNHACHPHPHLAQLCIVLSRYPCITIFRRLLDVKIMLVFLLAQRLLSG